MFTRIEPRSKEHEVVEQIQSLIFRGELLPGSKLPAEREFSKTLGVGRHTLRVALNRLAALGLVEIRKNEGTFVNSVTSAPLVKPLKEMLEQRVRNIEDFLEIRKVLESWGAVQAAKNASNVHLARMARALEQMKAAQGIGEAVAKADVEFHMALSEAAGNPILVHLMDSFVTLMHETRGLRLLITDPTVTQPIMRQHEEIYMAVRDQRAELASEKVVEHLTYIQQTIQKLVSSNEYSLFAKG